MMFDPDPPMQEKEEDVEIFRVYVQFGARRQLFILTPDQPLRQLIKAYVDRMWIGESPPFKFFELRLKPEDEPQSTDKSIRDFKRECNISNGDTIHLSIDNEAYEAYQARKLEDTRREEERMRVKQEMLEESREGRAADGKKKRKSVASNASKNSDNRYRCTIRHCKDEFAVKQGYVREGQYVKHLFAIHPGSTAALKYKREKNSQIQEKMTITSGIAKGWKIIGILEENQAATRSHDLQVKWHIENPKDHKVYTKFKSKNEDCLEKGTSEGLYQAIYTVSRQVLGKLQEKRREQEDKEGGRSRSRSRSLDSMPKGGSESHGSPEKKKRKRCCVEPHWSVQDLGRWLLDQPSDEIRKCAAECVNAGITGNDLCSWVDGNPPQEVLSLEFKAKKTLGGILGIEHPFFACGCSAHLVRDCDNPDIPEKVHLGAVDENKKSRFYRLNVPGIEGEIGLWSQNPDIASLVSRRHGFVEPRNGRWTISDNEPPTLNGIYVNGTRVNLQEFPDGHARRQVLVDGDTVTIGDIKNASKAFQFTFQEASY